MKSKIILLIRALMSIAVLAALGWSSFRLVHYLRTAPRFEVKKLSVAGADGPLKRVTEGEILAQAEFELGTNAFQVDLKKIREGVERLQWVRYAVVQRVLPDQIIVKVVERDPIGLARIRGDIYQFDADAAILSVDSVTDASFPVLDGLRRENSELNRKKVDTYVKVLEQLGETGLSEVRINDAGEVSIVSASDPMLVNLGTTDFRLRWIKYLQLKSQIEQQFPQAVNVDLRFNNQVIVRLKEGDTGEKIVWGDERKTL
jgi:cell division protein FtsQ